MYPDGICKVTANTFSKCIEFADISYQLAQADTKTAIFENLCDLYNYLDASKKRHSTSNPNIPSTKMGSRRSAAME